MPSTLYASFADPSLAEKAAGALMDFGVQPDDISLVSSSKPATDHPSDAGSREYVAHSATLEERRAPVTGYRDTEDEDIRRSDYADPASMTNAETSADPAARIAGVPFAADGMVDYDAEGRPHYITEGGRGEYATSGASSDPAWSGSHDAFGAKPYARDYDDESEKTELAAKAGISTTTPGDAAAGAAKGAGIGLGLGILGAIASIAIPGVGLVVGGGALATAIGLAAGTTAAGAVTGGVYGYLKDQGVPDEAARTYDQAHSGGGAVLAVQTSNPDVSESDIRQVLHKYGATNINAYGAV